MLGSGVLTKIVPASEGEISRVPPSENWQQLRRKLFFLMPSPFANLLVPLDSGMGAEFKNI